MGQRNRRDTPGSYHHVLNRGIARRPVFEDRREGRHFLALLARQVRAGRLEVVAYSLMTNHYHLLVRSPIGELSEAMRLVSSEYSRWFNRLHRRDGPLFRGRFRSFPVTSYRYRATLVRYIDANPVKARIVSHPSDYALGSARRFSQARTTRWLCEDWLRLLVDAHVPGDGPMHTKYRTFAARANSSAAIELVEARLNQKLLAVDPLDELVDSAPPRILDWMKRKTRLADGGMLLLPVCGPSAVREALDHFAADLVALREGWPAQQADAGAIMHAGLLRQLAGSTLSEAAKLLGVAETSVVRHGRCHQELMLVSDSRYADLAEQVAWRAVRTTTASSRPA